MELSTNNVSARSSQFVLFILIISSTLFFDSFFGFNGLVPIGISCSLLIALCLGIIKVRLNDFIITVFFVLCAFGTLIATYKYWNSDFSQFKNFIFLILGVLSFLAVRTIINKLDTYKISKIVNLIIIFHTLIFSIQLVCYYSLGYDLNIGLALGGNGHRAFTEEGVYRPTGVFDEPAIYSVFCAGLILMRLFYNKKLDWIILTGLLSIILSLSFVGFILASSILFIYSSTNFKLLIIALFLLTLALVFSPFFEGNYISNRFDLILRGTDPSTNSKLLVIQDFFSTQQLFNFGYGYIGLRDWTPTYYDAIYDLTFYISLVIEFGFYLGTILLTTFFIAVFTSKRPLNDVLALLILLIKLTATHYPFLWIVFAFFFSNKLVTNHNK